MLVMGLLPICYEGEAEAGLGSLVYTMASRNCGAGPFTLGLPVPQGGFFYIFFFCRSSVFQ